jgi:hypothetical protein
VLRISDERINLEGYQSFSEIMKYVVERIEFQCAAMETPHGKRITTMMKLVEETTKITHLQIVAYMSLFNGNKTEVLAESEVEEIMKFFKELWLWLLDCTSQRIEISWSKRVQYNLLNFAPYEKLTATYSTDKAKTYQLCWDFASHWVKKSRRSFKHKNGQDKTFDLFQIIDKMITF